MKFISLRSTSFISKKSREFNSLYPAKKDFTKPGYLIFILRSIRASSTTFTNDCGTPVL